ncbi:hypothetical protein ABT173_29300, partial [Streptomyces sp. NPDC001795]|uniref:hypothetical protein n=1 Tax=Streptomyces sp. NPDC001795 TaxID=3154525 RepID=UPI0033328834
MRAIRVASAALLGIGALALTGCTGPVANGDGGIGGFGYNVQPASVEPGGRLNLPVQGCNDNATVYSGAFEAVTIPRGRGSGTALVDRNVRPGEMYDVTFQCGRRYDTGDSPSRPGAGTTATAVDTAATTAVVA